MNPPKLPAKPQDGFTIRWFSIECTGARDFLVIHEYRLVYHKNTRWNDLFPDEPHNGLDLVDQWQVFIDGRFRGRAVGWENGPSRRAWDTLYATRAAAKKKWREALLSRARWMESEARHLRKLLRRTA